MLQKVEQNNLTNFEAENSRWKDLYKVSSVASLTLGVIFLIGALGFIRSIIWTEINGDWFSVFQSNWLIIIFKLHAGLISIQNNPLHGLNYIDVAILILFSILCFGLCVALKKESKFWSIFAFALSLITITLFIVTQTAGRSTVMLSVFIFSFVMLKNKIFKKMIIYTGVLASIFLFAGDLSVGIQSNIITFLFGIGYILQTIWFLLIARTFLKFGSRKREE